MRVLGCAVAAYGLLRPHDGAFLHRAVHKHHKPERRSMSHEDAIKAMGSMKIADLQPSYVFDDDYVRSGDSPYEKIEQERRHMAEEIHQLQAAEQKKAGELNDLHHAEENAHNVEMELKHKEGELFRARVRVNDTGIEDEQAVANITKDKYMDAAEKEAKARALKESAMNGIEEALGEIAHFEELGHQQRQEHGERLQLLHSLEDKYKKVVALEKRFEHVKNQQEKTQTIADMLAEEHEDIQKGLDAVEPERAELKDARDAVDETKDAIKETDAAITDWKETHVEEKLKLKEATEKLQYLPHQTVQREAEHDLAKEMLKNATATFDADEFEEAKKVKEQVEDELHDIQSQLDEAKGDVDDANDDVDSAASDLTDKVGEAKQARSDFHDVVDEVAHPSVKPAPQMEVAHNDPSTWLS